MENLLGKPRIGDALVDYKTSVCCEFYCIGEKKRHGKLVGEEDG